MNFRTCLMWFVPLAIGASALVAVPACSDDDTSSAGSTPLPEAGTSTLGVVVGAPDTHCGTNVVTVDKAQCSGDAGADDHHHDTDAGDTDAGDEATDGGETDGGAAEEETFLTLNNAEGDDDDCKYHVKWAVDSVTQNKGATFVVAVTNKSDGTPMTGGTLSAEVFLNDTHPAPNSNQAFKETSPGYYTVGPILFDAPGQWTARFHFNEACHDTEQSPHGHVSFLVAIP